jgi:predicted MFS family arabinose efflux permease
MTDGVTGGRLSPFRLLQLTAFVSTLDRFAMPPLLVAIALDLGVPLSSVVQAAGAYFLAYGVMQPVWGMVSDSLGLVRTLRLTLLIASVATIASAFVWTPLALGVVRAAAGGFFGAAYPSSLIYLGDTVAAAERQGQIARLMVGVAVGTAAASAGAGLLAQVYTWRAAFVLTGIAGLALTLALGRLVEPPVSRSHRNPLSPLLQVARSRVVVFVLALAFTEGAVLLGVLTLVPAAVEAAGESAGVAGAVTGAYGIAVYLFAHLVGRLSRRHHPARLIALGAVSGLLACVLLTFSRDPALVVGVALLLGLAWTSMHSSLQTWATEVMPAARATVVSLFAGSLFLGSAAWAVTMAGLADAHRYAVIFAVAALVTVPLGVAGTWGRARWRGRAAEAA